MRRRKRARVLCAAVKLAQLERPGIAGRALLAALKAER